MKQGNQFYLEFELTDEQDNKLDIENVDNVVFTIGNLTKYYNAESQDVAYDTEKQVFLVYLTQEETFSLKDVIKLEARIKFTNDLVMGSEIINKYVYDSLNKEVL